MKRILSIIVICLISICCLVACKAMDDKEKKENSITKESNFEKPIDYATVIEVSVNPVFKLYLDSDNKVLAIEPVNDDAKNVITEVEYDNETASSVVTKIIKCSEKKGFLKKSGHIDVKVIETQMSAKEQSNLIGRIEEELEEKFDKVVIKSTLLSEEQAPDVNAENNKTDNDPQENNSTSGSETDQSTQSTHTHTYSKATCTNPQTCSCGHTKGKKSGHQWNEATCSTPKTCATCKAKEGNAVEHIFDSEGKCKWCRQVLPISPSKLKKGAYCLVTEDLSYPVGDNYYPGIYVTQLDFNKNELHDASLLEYEYAYGKLGAFTKVDWYYKGKGYGDFEGGIEKFEVQILDNCIKIVVEDRETIELELLSNNTLKVISVVPDDYYTPFLQVGEVLVYMENAYHEDWAPISQMRK